MIKTKNHKVQCTLSHAIIIACVCCTCRGCPRVLVVFQLGAGRSSASLLSRMGGAVLPRYDECQCVGLSADVCGKALWTRFDTFAKNVRKCCFRIIGNVGHVSYTFSGRGQTCKNRRTAKHCNPQFDPQWTFLAPYWSWNKRRALRKLPDTAAVNQSGSINVQRDDTLWDAVHLRVSAYPTPSQFLGKFSLSTGRTGRNIAQQRTCGPRARGDGVSAPQPRARSALLCAPHAVPHPRDAHASAKVQ